MKKALLFLFGIFCYTFSMLANTMAPIAWVWVNGDDPLFFDTLKPEDQEQTLNLSISTSDSDSYPTLRLRLQLENRTEESLATTSLTYGLMDSVLLSINRSNRFCGDDPSLTSLGPDAAFNWKVSASFSDGAPITSASLFENSSDSWKMPLSLFSTGNYMSSSQQSIVSAMSISELEYCFTPTDKCVEGEYLFMPGGPNVLDTQFPKTYGWTPANLRVAFLSSLNPNKKDLICISNAGSSIQIAGLSPGTKIEIYNTVGQAVRSVVAQTNQVVLDGLAPNVYLLKMNGRTYKTAIR